MHPVLYRLDTRWAGTNRDQTPRGGALTHCHQSDGRGDAIQFEQREDGDRESECLLWGGRPSAYEVDMATEHGMPPSGDNRRRPWSEVAIDPGCTRRDNLVQFICRCVRN